MESSSTPPTSQQTNLVDDKYVIAFGSLSINDHGTGSGASVPSSSSPKDSHGKSSEELQETRVAEEETKALSSQAVSFPDLPTSQEVFEAITEWPATTSNPQSQINFWPSPFYNGGYHTPQNTFGTNDIAPGICNIGGVSFFHPNASLVYGNSGLNYPSRVQNFGTNVSYFSPAALNNNNRFVNDRIFWDHNNPNVHRGYYNSVNLALASPSVYSQRPESSLPGFDFFKMATSQDGSAQLRRILQQGKYIQETMRGVFPSIIQLMTDHYGHRIFEILLDRCQSHDLYAIVKKVNAERDSFLLAAFCETGSRSIQRLIRKLKNTGLEYVITLVLSKLAWQLMTHKIASHVTRQCFLVWGDEPNEVLHDCVFSYFLPLATDPMGCITINQCIDGIAGFRRAELLYLVASYASQLSYDPSGNFVVQHVLNLQNDLVTQKICVALKGQYVQLALKKGGSHVVEQCLQSHFGRLIAMDEILKNEKTLLMLAKDQFGNYVVQTALKVTMIHDKDTYQRLVQVLELRHPKIVQKVKEYLVNNKTKDPL